MTIIPAGTPITFSEKGKYRFFYPAQTSQGWFKHTHSEEPIRAIQVPIHVRIFKTCTTHEPLLISVEDAKQIGSPYRVVWKER